MKNNNQIFKILITFLVIGSFILPAKADIEIDNSKYSNLIMIDKVYMSPKGLLLGENNNNPSLNPIQGLYLDAKLELNPISKAMAGHRISDILFHQDRYYVSTINSVNGTTGIYMLDKDLQNPTHIGKNAVVTKMHIFQNRIFYGGDNIGLWSVKLDGSDNTMHFGGDTSGPKISIIGSNSKDLYFVTTGPLYYYQGSTGYVYNLVTLATPQNMVVFEDFLIISNKNKLFKVNLQGKILWEKSFTNNISLMTTYLDYLFIVERGASDQIFNFSKDKGETIYKSKKVFNSAYAIKSLAFTGTKEINVFVNFYNYGINKGRFIFDFEDNQFLTTPFSSSKSSDLVDKISSFFDHKYPLLGNLSEPEDAKNKTLNFMGKELPTPYLYYSSHDGIDFAVPMYTPILSAEAGEATYFYNPGGLGHAFVIYHSNGYVTVYGHLDEVGLVSKGTVTVSKGQKIGRVGMSGNTSGPHLHFVVYKGTRELQNKVDPFGWQANFVDPWSTYKFTFGGKELQGSKSIYIWKDRVNYQNKVLSSNQEETLDETYFSILSRKETNPNQKLISYSHTPPVYDQKNYQYRSNTSFSYLTSDLNNNLVSNVAQIKYKGFESYLDEKIYSIYEVKEGKQIRLESTYDQSQKTLGAEVNLNSDYLVLKESQKKIVSASNFKIK